MEKKYALCWVETEYRSNADGKWQFSVWLCAYRGKRNHETMGDRSRELYYESPFEHDVLISAQDASDKHSAKRTAKYAVNTPIKNPGYRAGLDDEPFDIQVRTRNGED